MSAKPGYLRDRRFEAPCPAAQLVAAITECESVRRATASRFSLRPDQRPLVHEIYLRDRTRHSFTVVVGNQRSDMWVLALRAADSRRGCRGEILVRCAADYLDLNWQKALKSIIYDTRMVVTGVGGKATVWP